jgi:hypothetical protein
MRWFRRYKVFGVQAALFALVVQFSLAFGHFHALEDHRGTASAAVVDLAIDKLGAPAPSDQNIPSDETCAICATIHLISAAQVAAAPTLPLPIVYPGTEFSLSSESIFDEQHCPELRSRGPPQA